MFWAPCIKTIHYICTTQYIVKNSPAEKRSAKNKNHFEDNAYENVCFVY